MRDISVLNVASVCGRSARFAKIFYFFLILFLFINRSFIVLKRNNKKKEKNPMLRPAARIFRNVATKITAQLRILVRGESVTTFVVLIRIFILHRERLTIVVFFELSPLIHHYIVYITILYLVFIFTIICIVT